MSAIEIRKGTRNGKDVTRIRIGRASGELPRHLMTGMKEHGYTVRDGKAEPWQWITVSDHEGERHIVCDPIDIIGFTEITATLRTQALSLVCQLAEALRALPASFVHPSGGFIETWRIFFIREGGLLILPQQLSQIILLSVEDEDRKAHHLRYLKPGVHPPFGLCHQCAQFLYLAAMGYAPYEPQEVRDDRWRHIPLALADGGIDKDTATMIDRVLSMSGPEQEHEVSAAYSAEENLGWFLDRFSTCQWLAKTQATGKDNQALGDFLAKQHKRVRAKRFWKTKGALVVTLAFTLSVLGYLGTSMAVKGMRPPYTAGWPAIDVIEEFFDARSDLDLRRMGATLARSVKNPFESEVSALHVNSRVRTAYEGIEPLVRADDWIARGKPPVDASMIIYGVYDLNIVHMGAERYEVSYHLIVPAGLEEHEDGHVIVVDQVAQVVQLSLTERRGYWEIEEITLTESHLEQTHRISTAVAAQ
jgi:hypothetical protein